MKKKRKTNRIKPDSIAYNLFKYVSNKYAADGRRLRMETMENGRFFQSANTNTPNAVLSVVR